MARAGAKARKRRPQETRWGLVLLIVTAVILVSGLGAAGIWFVIRQSAPATGSPTAGVRENLEDRRQEIKKALVDLKPVDEKEIAAELQPLFTDLGAAFRAANADKLELYFDVERLAEEFFALAPGALPNANQRRGFVRGMQLGLKQGLVRQAALIQWNGFEIRNVKKLNDREAVVIVRHAHPMNGTLKIRWWVTRREGTWKVFDFEDLDSGMRISTVIASVTQNGLGNVSALSRAATALSEAMQALQAGDLDTADKKLQLMAGLPLPTEFDALRHMLTGAIRIQRGLFQEALGELDRANAFAQTCPLSMCYVASLSTSWVSTPRP